MEPIKVVLPLPPRALHAHNKGHWRSKREAVKSYRDRARTACELELKHKRPELPGARLDVRFFWKDYRRRDNFNAAHSVKAAIDGCVDAGLVADDCWTVLQPCTVESERDTKRPRVELTFTPTDPVVRESPRGRKRALK